MDTQAIRDRLHDELRGVLERSSKIAANLRRESNPLGSDWKENASVLENDEVLDALDTEGRAHIAQLRAALGRIDAGTYGTCIRCDEPIAEERLAAIPEITTCIDCAREA